MRKILALKVEGGHPPRNVGSLKKLEKEENEFSPRTSKKECSPSNTLILAQGDLCQTLDLQTLR